VGGGCRELARFQRARNLRVRDQLEQIVDLVVRQAHAPPDQIVGDIAQCGFERGQEPGLLHGRQPRAAMQIDHGFRSFGRGQGTDEDDDALVASPRGQVGRLGDQRPERGMTLRAILDAIGRASIRERRGGRNQQQAEEAVRADRRDERRECPVRVCPPGGHGRRPQLVDVDGRDVAPRGVLGTPDPVARRHVAVQARYPGGA